MGTTNEELEAENTALYAKFNTVDLSTVEGQKEAVEAMRQISCNNVIMTFNDVYAKYVASGDYHEFISDSIAIATAMMNVCREIGIED